MSLSLRVCSNALARKNPVQRKLLNRSLVICDIGLMHRPKNATLYMSRGRTNYELGNPLPAIKDLEKAIELDAQQMWAALYLAHTLHDLERWEDAILAYRSVDLGFFSGDTSWRAVLLKDQIAICLLNAGHREEALSCFENSIRRYEMNPGLLTTPCYLVDAARGELKEQIGDRVLNLVRRDNLGYWL